MLKQIDNFIKGANSRWGVTVLRVALAVVFLWFGLLKIFEVSPVAYIVEASFDFLPFKFPFIYLGMLEVLIGLGLLFKIALRGTLGLMWLMLLGTFTAIIFNPQLFYSDNIFILTTEGEFVVKNLVLLASGMVIGSAEVK